MRKIVPAMLIVLGAMLLATMLAGCDSTGITPIPQATSAFASLRNDGAPLAATFAARAARAARKTAHASHANPRSVSPRTISSGSINVYVYTEPALGKDYKVTTEAMDIYSIGAFSSDGKKVAFSAYDNDTEYYQIYVGSVPAQGQAAPDAVRVTSDLVDSYSPEISPDGSKVVYVQWPYEGDVKLCVVSAGGTTAPNCPAITDFTPNWYEAPTWTPDGTKIVVEAYNCVSDCAEGDIIDNIFEINGDFSGTPRQITDNDGSQWTYYETPSISKDGTTMAVSRYMKGIPSSQEIYLFDMTTKARTGPLTNGSATNVYSYDPLFVGDKIVYVSESETDEHSRLYVMDKTGANATPISADTADSYFDDDYWYD